jgi:hypothetical protein
MTMRFVAGFSPWRPGFKPWAVREELVVDNVALGHEFFPWKLFHEYSTPSFITWDWCNALTCSLGTKGLILTAPQEKE